MEKNEPKMPDDVKTGPANEIPAEEKAAPIGEPVVVGEAPAPELEQPPEPREAPRKGEQEQIVFINLSELHAFKNHPFGVRDDEEMAAMVENVKDKGVTQPMGA